MTEDRLQNKECNPELQPGDMLRLSFLGEDVEFLADGRISRRILKSLPELVLLFELLDFVHGRFVAAEGLLQGNVIRFVGL